MLRSSVTARCPAKQMDERLEVLGALVDLVRRDRRDIGEFAARLLAHLTSERVLDGLTIIDTATG